ncbi:DNA-3-methyladenine glycosylase family protein [Streptomyces iconiensis]|uniref:DNA-3-methyladenine glycosylase 2 family protein n=1 Tax=Streptomyces iconiensis TaxID=1384038 RepID=A0ABT6ZNF6_9ACTN|nr:DNA-3-methyladenine glycosylase 2 family protein [Streptomyces iconiensis]MDJ1130585.1 DNA-3-methyladenine glycosylase 2 family protein [Streptomyces iconiensis]
MKAVVLTPTGPFSLMASLRFLEGFTPASYRGGHDGVLRLAFPSDDGQVTVTAAVRQEAPPTEGSGSGAGAVHADITFHPAAAGTGTAASAAADHQESAIADVARILSLDVDGSSFPALASADPVVAGLMEEFPELRPVCFNSPYEAAAWAVIGNRVRKSHAAAAKTLLAQRHGQRVEVAGQELFAFPAPHVLRAVTSFPGLSEVKIQRLHALADASAAGLLDAAALRAMPAQEALAALQELPGIGPFSAELILIRGAGHPDLFPRHEPRLHTAMTAAYGLEDEASADVPELARVAERWKPYRSWVALLLRAHADPNISRHRTVHRQARADTGRGSAARGTDVSQPSETVTWATPGPHDHLTAPVPPVRTP